MPYINRYNIAWAIKYGGCYQEYNDILCNRLYRVCNLVNTLTLLIEFLGFVGFLRFFNSKNRVNSINHANSVVIFYDIGCRAVSFYRR
jgi:hypothetical protein